MALTIETGAIVTGANSYVTVDEFRAYAEARGIISISSDDADYEVYLIKAMDKLESYRARYQGEKVDSDQPLQFPRVGVWVDGFELEETTIPRELKYAQMAFAMESLAGNDLNPTVLTSTPAQVTKEKVGEIEVTYANPSSLRSSPAFAKAEALLAPLLKKSGLFAVRA